MLATIQIEFIVEDSGIGITPDQHQVISERFRQVGAGAQR